MSDNRFEFTRDNIDFYLNEVAKEYSKRCKKAVPAEFILIGGASVLINYGFRNMTTDVDALVQATSVMKDAINAIADKYDLPVSWLNSDFKRTDSYTPKIVQFSDFYKRFYNILDVRTVAGEYLIAMKLRSGRQYKSDLSDVLGILSEHEKRGVPIGFEQIKKAVTDLYGDWKLLPETSLEFIDNVMRDGQFEKLYSETVAGEKNAKDVLIKFDKEYPATVNESNIDEIIRKLREKNERE